MLGDVLDLAPIAAAACAVPQFLPQIVRVHATRNTAGVSWTWAALTSVNNGAWIAYFALSGFWTALVPASSATLLAGALAMMLARRRKVGGWRVAAIGTWVVLLAAALATTGRTGLGALLTAAFVLQVAPSIWTAYRSDRPTGISSGTWTLILGELSCWALFGLHKADARLTVLGFTGVTAGVLMLARVHRVRSQVAEEQHLVARADRGPV
jgi:uncharacterized protein with PQ loop repeat